MGRPACLVDKEAARAEARTMTIQDKLRAEMRRKRVAAVAPLQAAPGRRQHDMVFGSSALHPPSTDAQMLIARDGRALEAAPSFLDIARVGHTHRG